jgi:hypothetical protein
MPESSLLTVEEVPSSPPATHTAGKYGDWACWAAAIEGKDAQALRHNVRQIFDGYNFFFEHIGIKKGWRQAPFERDEVQDLFDAAAELVALIRTKLDEERGGPPLIRQVEGSAMDFLWGWAPDRRPSSTTETQKEFVRGLVLNTLSDRNGLVEGLDVSSVDRYLYSHPLFATAERPGIAEDDPGTLEALAPKGDPCALEALAPD